MIVAFSARVSSIGSLEPFVDESINILVGADDGYAYSVDVFGQGRPLLKVLFAPAVTLAHWINDLNLLFWARWQTACVGTLLVALVEGILLALFGPLAAFVGGVSVALCPLLFAHDRLALQDPYNSLFLALAIVSWIRSEASRSSNLLANGWATATGMFAALAVLNKITSVLATPWLGGLLWILSGAKPQKRVLFAAGGAAATLFPFVFHWNEIGLRLLQFGHQPAFLGGNHDPAVSIAALPQLMVQGFGPIKSFLLGYNSIWFCLLLIISYFLSIRTSRMLAPLRYGIALELILSAIAYSRVDYARYFHSSMVPQIILICSLVPRVEKLRSAAKNWGRNVNNILLGVWAALLIMTLTTWTVTVASLLRNPLSNLLIGASAEQQTDYEQYSVSSYSGRGLEPIFSNFELIAQGSSKSYLFASAGHFAGARAFGLRYLSSPRVLVREICFQSPHALLAVAAFMQESHRRNEHARFFVLDEWVDGVSKADELSSFFLARGFTLAGGEIVDRQLLREPGFMRIWEIRDIQLMTLMDSLPITDIQPEEVSEEARVRTHVTAHAPWRTLRFEVTPKHPGTDGDFLLIRVDQNRFDHTVPISHSGLYEIEMDEDIPVGSHTIEVSSSAFDLRFEPSAVACKYRGDYSASAARIGKFTVR